METIIDWSKYSTQSGDLYIRCYSDGENIFCCEHTDDPMELNYETSCTIQEFLNSKIDEARICQNFISERFGEDALQTIIKYFSINNY